jgi:hypothetical protein
MKVTLGQAPGGGGRTRGLDETASASADSPEMDNKEKSPNATSTTATRLHARLGVPSDSPGALPSPSGGLCFLNTVSVARRGLRVDPESYNEAATGNSPGGHSFAARAAARAERIAHGSRA